MGRLLTLLTGAAIFWVVTAPPVQYLAGDEWALLFSGTALLICLVPAAVTLWWADHAFRQDPQGQVLAVLGGTGVRMFAVLVIALVLSLRVPPFKGNWSFLVWLVVCYLFILALEIYLVLRGRSGSSDPSPSSSSPPTTAAAEEERRPSS